MSNFQRDPSLSTRVSRGSDAWRALINSFDHRGVGKTVSLLKIVMEHHGDNESISAHLQHMMHCYQDVNEVEHNMVKEKLLVSATLYNIITTSYLAHVPTLMLSKYG
jgi:transposase-like protein